MADNKNPNQKQPGEKPPGKYHFNPGNMSGKTLDQSREEFERGPREGPSRGTGS